jgi:hypothetical protein
LLLKAANKKSVRERFARRRGGIERTSGSRDLMSGVNNHGSRSSPTTPSPRGNDDDGDNDQDRLEGQGVPCRPRRHETESIDDLSETSRTAGDSMVPREQEILLDDLMMHDVAGPTAAAVVVDRLVQPRRSAAAAAVSEAAELGSVGPRSPVHGTTSRHSNNNNNNSVIVGGDMKRLAALVQKEQAHTLEEMNHRISQILDLLVKAKEQQQQQSPSPPTKSSTATAAAAVDDDDDDDDLALKEE